MYDGVKIFTVHSLPHEGEEKYSKVQGRWYYPNGPSSNDRENALARWNGVGEDIRWMIDDTIPKHQKLVFDKFNIPIEQYIYQPWNGHGAGVDQYIKNLGDEWEVLVLFDVDCIPLNDKIVKNVIDIVRSSRTVIGCAQFSSPRAHQLRRDNSKQYTHVYAGPMFISFTRETYEYIGKPSFQQTTRHDVGGEVTAAAFDKNVEVLTLLPKDKGSSPYRGALHGRYWKLPIQTTTGQYETCNLYKQPFMKINPQPSSVTKCQYLEYGLDTIYGNDDIYHAFEAQRGCRGWNESNKDRFVDKCKQILSI